jgi:hypothetical protein
MGFYVIEDFAVAYDEGRRENQAPQWPMLKTLVDDTLHRYTHSFTPAVASLHMYGEIAVVQKPPAGISPQTQPSGRRHPRSAIKLEARCYICLAKLLRLAGRGAVGRRSRCDAGLKS